MKKVLIPLIAIILFISCDTKSKNGKSRNVNNREKDDYRNGDKNQERDEETNEKMNTDS